MGNCGVQPIYYGTETYFRPWYFNGQTVLWGSLQSTWTGAEDAAQALRDREWSV